MKLCLYGFPGKELNPRFARKSQILAGDRMYQEEIKKALAGEKYFIFGLKGEKQYLEPVTNEEFRYYHGVYKRMKYFGLPHEGGWYHQQSWYLDFYIEFHEAYEDTLEAIKHEAIEREHRKLKSQKGKSCQR